MGVGVGGLKGVGCVSRGLGWGVAAGFGAEAGRRWGLRTVGYGSVRLGGGLTGDRGEGLQWGVAVGCVCGERCADGV